MGVRGGSRSCSMEECSHRPHLCGAEVAELELVGVRVDEQVLRLDVPVAYAHGVDVRQRAAHLEHVQLHKQRGHALPALAVVLADAEHRLRHKLQDQVQVHLQAEGGRLHEPGTSWLRCCRPMQTHARASAASHYGG